MQLPRSLLAGPSTPEIVYNLGTSIRTVTSSVNYHRTIIWTKALRKDLAACLVDRIPLTQSLPARMPESNQVNFFANEGRLIPHLGTNLAASFTTVIT